LVGTLNYLINGHRGRHSGREMSGKDPTAGQGSGGRAFPLRWVKFLGWLTIFGQVWAPCDMDAKG